VRWRGWQVGGRWKGVGVHKFIFSQPKLA
jgi:hypothetical protein